MIHHANIFFQFCHPILYLSHFDKNSSFDFISHQNNLSVGKQFAVLLYLFQKLLAIFQSILVIEYPCNGNLVFNVPETIQMGSLLLWSQSSIVIFKLLFFHDFLFYLSLSSLFIIFSIRLCRLLSVFRVFTDLLVFIFRLFALFCIW